MNGLPLLPTGFAALCFLRVERRAAMLVPIRLHDDAVPWVTPRRVAALAPLVARELLSFALGVERADKDSLLR